MSIWPGLAIAGELASAGCGAANAAWFAHRAAAAAGPRRLAALLLMLLFGAVALDAAAHNPAYGAYVEQERRRLGERHPLFRTQYLLEELHEQDRLLDGAALAQLEGAHERRRTPQRGERYVAGLDLAGPALEGRGPESHDWTVLTIARVRAGGGDRAALPLIEVVEHQAWQGVPAGELLDALADRLARVWRVRRVVVDATGLGGPVADLLARRLPSGRVAPFTFTAERKSQLGFGLLAAAHSGRLRLYRIDGSREAAECRVQLERARAAYGERGRMQFSVDPSEGHDDYLMSLALAAHAARDEGGSRAARGRTPGESVEAAATVVAA